MRRKTRPVKKETDIAIQLSDQDVGGKLCVEKSAANAGKFAIFSLEMIINFMLRKKDLQHLIQTKIKNLTSILKCVFLSLSYYTIARGSKFSNLFHTHLNNYYDS
jgi:hypothetical protein